MGKQEEQFSSNLEVINSYSQSSVAGSYEVRSGYSLQAIGPCSKTSANHLENPFALERQLSNAPLSKPDQPQSAKFCRNADSLKGSKLGR